MSELAATSTALSMHLVVSEMGRQRLLSLPLTANSIEGAAELSDDVILDPPSKAYFCSEVTPFLDVRAQF